MRKGVSGGMLTFVAAALAHTLSKPRKCWVTHLPRVLLFCLVQMVWSESASSRPAQTIEVNVAQSRCLIIGFTK